MKQLLFALVMLLASACAGAQPRERIATIENGLRGPIVVAGEPVTTSSIVDRMKHYDVPGVSIAVIDRGRIGWAKGYGVAREGQAVTPDTRFQAGSISKPVTAVAAMMLVQSGRLSLDSDVNSLLRSWKLPATEFASGAPVRLRQLLSHTAGIGVHAFYPGYEPGQTLPTSVQILNGQRPATNPQIKVEAQPGTAFDYSGGGYQVVQQLLADVSGREFAPFMRTQLFEPLHMRFSSFEQRSPASAPKSYAFGFDRSGVQLPVKWYLHPELAAAGLWSTPTDLARVGIAVSEAWNGERNPILNGSTARAMLTKQTGGWGLGFQIEGDGSALRFRHGGDNPGFKAVMVMFPGRRQGAVIMTNGDRGDRLADEILFSIADAYQWPGFAPKIKVRAAVPASELARVAGTYALQSLPDVRLRVAPKGDGLSMTLVQPSGESTTELLPAGNGKFFRRDIDFELHFSSGAPAAEVTLIQDGETYAATRVAGGK